MCPMAAYHKIFLKQGKEAAVKRFHPWIFSGAIGKIPRIPAEGDIVDVFSSNGEYLATGHYLNGSIAVKIFSFRQRTADDTFWEDKITEAYNLRAAAGLTDNPLTTAYRLVFSEGDELPGLIIDWYNGTAVIQTHSMGMHRIKPVLVKILREIYGEKLEAIYDKSSETMKLTAAQGRTGNTSGQGSPAAEPEIRDQYLFGNSGKGTILETGHSFRVDWEGGQKTGFFLDQRSNRMFAQFYAKGRKVLNAFCFTGAFSVYAMKGGAATVHSVDSSKTALQLLEENLALNGIGNERHVSFAADVKKWLPSGTEEYDMIILDPPAFAKHHNVSHNALLAYSFINAEALKKLTSGGILMTFSCSQAISREMFQSAVLSAAIQTGRKVRVLHHLAQGPDHPVSIYHPEGMYLKGLILYAE
jgi:23S rRNA (cytosine1962-C5)-methyltransferase